MLSSGFHPPPFPDRPYDLHALPSPAASTGHFPARQDSSHSDSMPLALTPVPFFRTWRLSNDRACPVGRGAPSGPTHLIPSADRLSPPNTKLRGGVFTICHAGPGVAMPSAGSPTEAWGRPFIPSTKPLPLVLRLRQVRLRNGSLFTLSPTPMGGVPDRDGPH